MAFALIGLFFRRQRIKASRVIKGPCCNSLQRRL